MSVQHANIGIIKKDLQLYYNREYNGSFLGEATVNLFSIPISLFQNQGNQWLGCQRGRSNQNIPFARDQGFSALPPRRQAVDA